jgi:hypothetical protein
MLVATTEHVSAVTLLNHFTRYRIATNGVAQVSTDGTGQWLYLLDAETQGFYRLRAFDVPSGSERALQAGIVGVIKDGRVQSAAIDGRVLVLKSDAHRTWVDAYAAPDLRLLGTAMEGPGCDDRLLASGSRVAIVCGSTGEIAVDDLRGKQAAIDGALPNLATAAMADDGTLYVATADEQLAAFAGGATKLVSVPWPSEWSGNMVERKSLRLAGVPQGGVLTLWPFAYHSVGHTIRHVDLTSGLLETMTEVRAGAVPGAMANR